MNEFDVILEECIDLIASGEVSLEECLSSYPEYAAQLEPILITVSCLQEEGRELVPPPALRARIRGELDHAMKENSKRKAGSLFFLANGIHHVRTPIDTGDDQYSVCPGSVAGRGTLQLEIGQREPLAGSSS